MVVFLNTANDHVLSLIRNYKDTYHPTAWTTSDLSTGTATPVFDSMFHELIPLWVTHQFTNDNKMRSAVADEIQVKERELIRFYSTHFFRPFTITIAAPGLATLNDHGFTDRQEVWINTTGTLPTGLSANTLYYVIVADNDTFQLSATKTGSAITTSVSQTGTHYISGLRPPRLIANYHNTR